MICSVLNNIDWEVSEGRPFVPYTLYDPEPTPETEITLLVNTKLTEYQALTEKGEIR